MLGLAMAATSGYFVCRLGLDGVRADYLAYCIATTSAAIFCAYAGLTHGKLLICDESGAFSAIIPMSGIHRDCVPILPGSEAIVQFDDAPGRFQLVRVSISKQGRVVFTFRLSKNDQRLKKLLEIAQGVGSTLRICPKAS
jgi:hypothetical protein